MGRKRYKLKRFAEIKNFSQVIDGFERKENVTLLFQKEAPLVIELGCGKGDYTIALAEMNPTKIFLGVDIKGERIWVGAKKVQEKNLQNVLFLRVNIEKITDFFLPHSVSEIWITFPDPFPKKKDAKHRLTSPQFLRMYRELLVAKGIVRLKTDDEDYYLYTIETVQDEKWKILKAYSNLYRKADVPEELRITTDYERRHLKAGKKIYYLEFTLR